MSTAIQLNLGTSQFDRSSTVTDYAASQQVSNGRFLIVPLVFNDTPVYLRRLSLRISPALSVAVTFGIHLFTEDPGAFISPTDYGAVNANSANNAGIYEGRFNQVAVNQSSSTVVEWTVFPSGDYAFSSRSGCLFAILETQTVFTPVASQRFILKSYTEAFH